MEALARRTDPQTSHDAAAAVDVRGLELKTLRQLQSFYLLGLTCAEIARLCSEPRDSISPRMRALAKRGLVEDTGETRKPVDSKRRQIVWRITRKGSEITSSKTRVLSQSDPT